MMSIPYLTPGGVVAMKFRCVQDHDCKAEKCQRYDSPPGQKAKLYNVLSLLEPGDTVAVVEGELAALIFSTQVGIPTVGTPSTQWHDHWARCLADFDRVLVIADHDVKDDGGSPGIKHAKQVVSKVPGAELILPPAGLDADEWVLADGVAAVRERLGL